MGKGGKRRHHHKSKNADVRRRMKIEERKDDIPDCPSLDNLEVGNEENNVETAPAKTESATSIGSTTTTSTVVSSQYCQDARPAPLAAAPESGVPHQYDSQVDGYSYASQISNDYYSHKPLIDFEKMAPVVEGVGQVAMEVFFQLSYIAKYAVQYPTPFAFMFIIVGAYMTVTYLEVSLAAAIDLLVGLAWPPIHVALRAVESFFQSLSSWFGSVDDLGQAAYCDMAAVWCHKFKLMCEVQCSFTTAALDRFRHLKHR